MTDRSNRKTKQPAWAIRPLVPESVYTDRQEHLDYFYRAALDALDRLTMSSVLLGQRRMGKTEIFKRVVNRLFFEQEHYADPARSVVPVYYSFKDTMIDRWDFCIDYVENFIRWYAAFRLRDLRALSTDRVSSGELLQFVRDNLAVTEGLEGSLSLCQALRERAVTLPEARALEHPRKVSDWDDSTIVVFLDEFQNTRLPQHGFDIVGYFHESVESPTCPHFVTGSAMTILSREILGRGSLFGRFWSHPIETMTPYWGTELARRAARQYRAELPEHMAPLVAERCGGNPFYITAVARQAAESRTPLDSQEALDKTLAVDISSGFIWAELSDQVTRWIERVNEHGITKWVLYLSAIQEGDKLGLEEIQSEIKRREGKYVPLETIREVLIRLSRGDLVEYLQGGDTFRRVQDPILVDFLKVWGRIVVEAQAAGAVADDLRLAYDRRERRILDHLGYIAEVYMAQVLWNAQKKSLPGGSLHQDADISIDDHWSYIWHRVPVGPGPDMEVDVVAAAGPERWLCESKWWRGRKVGLGEVAKLIQKGKFVREKVEELRLLRLWFFAHDGFTAEAEKMMQEAGVFYSDRDDLNALLTHVGLRLLPEL